MFENVLCSIFLFNRKCQHDLKPTISSISINDDKHDYHSMFVSVLSSLKYLIGGILLLSLPFIFLKAILFPLKIILGLKAIAFANTLLFGTFVYKYLNRLNRLNANNNGNNGNNNFFGFGNNNNKKIESIKQIIDGEEEIDLDEADDADGSEGLENRIYYNRLSNISALSDGSFDENFLNNLLKLNILIKKNNLKS